MFAAPLAAALARRGIHYGWVMVALTFLIALSSAGALGVLGALLLPVQRLDLRLRLPGGGDQAAERVVLVEQGGAHRVRLGAGAEVVGGPSQEGRPQPFELVPGDAVVHEGVCRAVVWNRTLARAAAARQPAGCPDGGGQAPDGGMPRRSSTVRGVAAAGWCG